LIGRPALAHRFKFIKYFFQSKKGGEISPDEILLDSRNLPNYDISQFEGRIEQSISKKALFTLVGAFFLIALIFVIQSFKLQVIHGQEYLTRSENNTLRPIPLFAGRGIITDRNGIQLAWNAPLENATSSDTVAVRRYATSTGLSHILGYVKYPSKDNNGFYYQDDFEGEAGAEKYFDEPGSAVTMLERSPPVQLSAKPNVILRLTICVATLRAIFVLAILYFDKPPAKGYSR
jgi:hypothetical protein